MNGSVIARGIFRGRARAADRRSGPAFAVLLAVAVIVLPPHPATRADSFRAWVAGLWPQARDSGISRRTFETAFAGVTFDPEVMQAADHQPEFVRPIWDYLERAASDKRIAGGREMLRRFAPVLDAIEAVYGVDRKIIIAIWGLESSYGQFRGDKNVIRSLASLGYQGPRTRFGRTQLLAALSILERGDIRVERLTGSWAGAMGHTQFIPTTYNAYAVDFDGDGRRDIWDTVADALASAANYLSRSGWKPGVPWGYEVVLPQGFDFALAEETARPVREWRELGVRRPAGQALTHEQEQASLILPAGAAGPAFLVFGNFKAILRYNNATAYALAVGHLADRIAGEGPFKAGWPTGDRPLADGERRRLQLLLEDRGYSVGAIDGIIGGRTRSAIRSFQRAAGLPPDGYASLRLLERLENR